MTAGSIRRSTKGLPAVGVEEIQRLCLKAEHGRTACLVALLYLFAGRISEVLHLRKRMVRHLGGSWVGFTTPVLKKNNPRTCPKCKVAGQNPDTKKPNGPQLTEREIGERSGVKVFKCNSCGFRFERKIPYELVKVKLDAPTTEILWPFIERHLDSLESEDYIFHSKSYASKSEHHIGRAMAWKLLIDLDKHIWTHWLRHQRASGLVHDAGFDIWALRAFMKWDSLETAKDYVHGIELEEKLAVA